MIVGGVQAEEPFNAAYAIALSPMVIGHQVDHDRGLDIFRLTCTCQAQTKLIKLVIALLNQ